MLQLSHPSSAFKFIFMISVKIWSKRPNPRAFTSIGIFRFLHWVTLNLKQLHVPENELWQQWCQRSKGFWLESEDMIYFYKIFIVLLNHIFKPKWPVFAHVPFNIVHTIGTAATWYPQCYDQYVRLLTWLCRPLNWVKSESLRRWTRFSIPLQFVVLSFMNLNLYVNSVLEQHTESATASERL